MNSALALDEERENENEEPANTTESVQQPEPATRKKVKEKPGRELTSAQLAERTRITDVLIEAYDELDKAVEAYNSAMEELQAPVNTALEALNGALSDARALRDEIVSDADEYIENRSEKWQESETGQEVRAYKEQWEYAELDDKEIEFPEAIQMPDLDPETILNDLPETAEPW